MSDMLLYLTSALYLLDPCMQSARYVPHPMYASLVPRPHPMRERGSGDFVQKPQSLLTFRQEFQTANEIVENSILSLLGVRS